MGWAGLGWNSVERVGVVCVWVMARRSFAGVDFGHNGPSGCSIEQVWVLEGGGDRAIE